MRSALDRARRVPVAAVFSVIGILLVGGLALALSGGSRSPRDGGEGRLGLQHSVCRFASAKATGTRMVAVVQPARVTLPTQATARVVVLSRSGARRVFSVTRRGTVSGQAQVAPHARVRETVTARGRACVAPGPSAASQARSRAAAQARRQARSKLPAVLSQAATNVARRLRPTAVTAARSRARAALLAPARAQERRLLALATAQAERQARRSLAAR